MKLSVLLLLVALHISAKGVSQQISISVENAPLSQVLRSVARQSNVSLMYSESLLKNTHPVTLRMRKVSVREALNACLKGQPLTYTMQGDHILIQPKTGYNVALEKDTTITVQGKITAAGQTPLAGVTVLVKGTTTGTITNAEGHYTVEATPVDTLVFRYLGYQERHVAVGDRQTINIQLQPASSQLDQLIVVGYGTQKKETVTGAVEQVGSETFKSRSVTNPALALQGATPGLVVTRSSPRPGNEGIAFNIRGVTSVNGGSPLIVIDGVPTVNSEALYSMNPDDISSVTVLKDGMAAIYGARAANGVILVTTKRGKGEMKVSYNGNIRFNTIGIETPVPTMQQYATIWLDANKEEVQPDYWGWKSKENLEKMQKGIEGIYETQFWGDAFIGKGNRFDELFQPRLSQQHNLSVSGSTDKTAYRLSAAYANNQANLATAYDGKKQYDLRLNYDYDVSKRIKLQTGVSYQKSIVSSPSSGLSSTLVAFDPPFFPAKNPYGEWYANFNIAGNRNSVAATTDGGRDKHENSLIKVDAKVTVGITDNLSIEATASVQSNQYRRDMYQLTVPTYQWNGTPADEIINSTSSIRAESQTTFYQNYGAFLKYDKQIKEHSITAMAGVTAEKNDYKRLYGYRTNIDPTGVYDLNLAGTDKVEATGGQNHWGLYSYVGRVNYNYKGKYLIELLGRRDGSSRFAPGYRWSNFGNASVGWIVTDETFMEHLRSAINFLKFRASYGETGNQVGIGLYDYLSTIGLGTSVFGTPAALQTSAWVNGITSNTRTWERVSMKNIGVDMAFLDHRLSATFDYYQKENNGMLINISYPSLLGASAPKSNSGKLRTKGWEAVLGWKDKKGGFSYHVSVNMSNNNNKLLRMEGADTWNAGKVHTRVGYPIDSWFMYVTNGYFANQKEVDDYYAKYTSVKQGEIPAKTDPTQNLRPGDTRKVDLDGNGYISSIGDPTKGDQGDVKFMGDDAPHYVYGINLGGSWKGFDLTAFFQGVMDQHIQRSGWLAFPFATTYTNQPTAFMGKTWTEDNPNAPYPRLTRYSDRAKWDYINNDFMLQNNRYIRLKSLIIGYTIPASITERVGVDEVRVYFSGNDLWEATAIKDGYDPEQGETTQNDGYPFYRTWSFGLNVSF